MKYFKVQNKHWVNFYLENLAHHSLHCDLFCTSYPLPIISIFNLVLINVLRSSLPWVSLVSQQIFYAEQRITSKFNANRVTHIQLFLIFIISNLVAAIATSKQQSIPVDSSVSIIFPKNFLSIWRKAVFQNTRESMFTLDTDDSL